MDRARTLKGWPFALLASCGLMGLAACEESSDEPIEDAAESVEDAAEDAEDAVDDAIDETDDAIDDATDDDGG